MSVKQYVELLSDNGAELNQLYKDLLIGVTPFFRDREAFHLLASEELPRLLESDSQTDTERGRRHQVNNKLNALTLKLQLLQRQISRGTAVEPATQLTDVVGQLSDLEIGIPDCVATEKSPRVLIVEDQANERELLADCLKLSGIPVATAVNGLDAFN